MKKLNKKEESELKGGVVSAPRIGDVTNKNSVSNCKCTFIDNGAVKMKIPQRDAVVYAKECLLCYDF